MNLANPLENKKEKEPIKTWRIFLATFSANIGMICVGTCLGWTSPIVAQLKLNEKNSPLDHVLNAQEIAWITSILSIGAAITPLPSGYIAEKFGRKLALLLSSIFFILSYIIMFFVNKTWHIYLGRFLQGSGSGIVFSVIPMYVGEISIDRVRGATLSLMILFINNGIIIVFCLGPFVSYKVLQVCCLCVPILYIIIFSFMPETPLFYVEQNEILKAQKSLQFLRGQSADSVQEELSILQKMVANSLHQKSDFAELLRKHGNRKALLICFGLIFLQQSSGMNAIMFNNQLIFEAAHISIEAHFASIIVIVVCTIAAICGPIVVFYFRRRLIIIVSSVFMAFGLISLGIYYFYFEIQNISINWLPVPSMLLYVIFFVMCFSQMPYLLLGEMFPPNVKSLAISLGITFNWIVVFFITFSFPIISEIGTFYLFWFYGLVSVLAFFFGLFIVVETKDLSLEEIHDILENKI